MVVGGPGWQLDLRVVVELRFFRLGLYVVTVTKLQGIKVKFGR